MNRVKQFARSRLLTKDQNLQTNYYLELVPLLNGIILDTALACLHIKGDQSEKNIDPQQLPKLFYQFSSDI
jgi:hypothetical protein